MKIILLQNIKSLGEKGDIKEVSNGYARNFLLPKKIAMVATEESIKSIKLQKEKEEEVKTTKLEELKTLANKLKNRKIIISAKEKSGKLFGSITAKTISEELGKEGLKISEDSIIIKEAIKKVGKYEFQIRLAKNIQAKIKLEVRGS